MSVYLCVPDFQSLDPGWSRRAHFTLSVVDQKDELKTHSCGASLSDLSSPHSDGFSSATLFFVPGFQQGFAEFCVSECFASHNFRWQMRHA